MRRRRFVAAIAAVVVAIATPAAATPIGGDGEVRFGRSDVMGFDPCGLPTTSQMATWWRSSPYFDIGIYIGGSDRACLMPGLNSTWATNAHNQGWGFYPIWVGPQPACWTGGGATMSSTSSVARQQGLNEAVSAIQTMRNLGFTGINVIYYDMEGYPTSNSVCRDAVDAFVDGWDTEIQAVGEKAGVYGSSCASAPADWVSIAHVPDYVWLGAYNGDPDVWGLQCIADQLWNGGRRLHQYRGSHIESWGGLSIANVDNDCAYGGVVPHGHGVSDIACTRES
jgi:hypothetical protein